MKRTRKRKKMSPQVRAMLKALKRSRRSKRKAARTNPPRRRAKAKAARRPRRASAGPSIHATRLGKVRSITYTHAVDGKLYRHAFGRGTNVAYTRDRKMVLWPVQIQPFIGDHQ